MDMRMAAEQFFQFRIDDPRDLNTRKPGDEWLQQRHRLHDISQRAGFDQTDPSNVLFLKAIQQNPSHSTAD